MQATSYFYRGNLSLAFFLVNLCKGFIEFGGGREAIVDGLVLDFICLSCQTVTPSRGLEDLMKSENPENPNNSPKSKFTKSFT
jgi:hypothetical protein